jgi:plasmid stabilization system protein ParE
MEKQIVWTPEAEKTLNQIVEYLEQHWTEKEVQKLFIAVENVVNQIQKKSKNIQVYFK